MDGRARREVSFTMRALALRPAPMSQPVPPVIYVHMFAAIAALVLGTIQLARAKGTSSHKLAGWTWVLLMLTAAVSSLWMPAFLHLRWIHIFTLVTFVSLPVALWSIRHGDVKNHADTMKGLYIGGLVIAGAFAFSPGRLLGDLVWKGCWNC